MSDFIEAAETCERAAQILRMMAEEDKPEPYIVDAPAFLPPVGGSASVMHVESADWPEGERNEHTAAEAYDTHSFDPKTQSCAKCGMPHPVFIAQGWPRCPA